MPDLHWYKGNIHTHTTESDGDEEPQKVVSWYRKHNYDFLVLSDHNHVTMLDYQSGIRRLKRPLMIPGEEVSVNLAGGTIAVHINGIGVERLVEPIDAGDVVSTLQANIKAIVDAGGIASINHPNFKWSYDHESIRQVTGASLLEIFYGHPSTNLYGGPGRHSSEEIWDKVLSGGKPIFGVATDDSHNYKDFSPSQSNPGRGWVMVQSTALTKESILEALATGNFYSSTGVNLNKLEISPQGISIEIEEERDFIYTTRFTTEDGNLLAEVDGLTADYRSTGKETYIRATVNNSSGTKAWTQPVFLTEAF